MFVPDSEAGCGRSVASGRRDGCGCCGVSTLASYSLVMITLPVRTRLTTMDAVVLAVTKKKTGKGLLV